MLQGCIETAPRGEGSVVRTQQHSVKQQERDRRDWMQQLERKRGEKEKETLWVRDWEGVDHIKLTVMLMGPSVEKVENHCTSVLVFNIFQ